MIPRATRHPDHRHPLIQQGAQTPEDMARVVNGIYDGWLADERALTGSAGVYSVKVISPLKITDEGIALDMTDPQFAYQFRQMSQGFGLTDTNPLAISGTSAGVTSGAGLTASRWDHVHRHYQPSINEYLTFYSPVGATDTPTTGITANVVGYMSVAEIIENADANFHSRVSQGLGKYVNVYGQTGGSAGAPGTGFDAVVEVAIEYSGAVDVDWTDTDNGTGWNAKIGMYWARGAVGDKADMNDLTNVVSQAGFLNPGVGSNSGLATPIVYTPIVAGALTFELAIDENDSYKLKYRIVNAGDVAIAAAWYVKILVAGTVPTTGYVAEP